MRKLTWSVRGVAHRAQFSQMDETIQRRLQPVASGGSDVLTAVAAAVGAAKHSFDQLLVTTIHRPFARAATRRLCNCTPPPASQPRTRVEAHRCSLSAVQPVSSQGAGSCRGRLPCGPRSAPHSKPPSARSVRSPLHSKQNQAHQAHTTLTQADVLLWGSRGRPRRPGDRSHPAAARRRARRRRRAARPANAAAGRAGAPAPHLAGRAGRGGRGTGHRRARM